MINSLISVPAKGLAVASVLLLQVLPAVAPAQTGRLVLEDFFDKGFFIVQGGKVIGSFPRIDGDADGPASPFIAIGTLTTSPMWDAGTTGYEYDYEGNILRTFEVLPHEAAHDAGTDGGRYIYNAANLCGPGAMYRFDMDWQNPELLFNFRPVGGACSLGTTYDPRQGTIWIQSYPGSTISEYDLAGNVLTSFESVGLVGGLAYETETDTLWTAEDGFDSNQIAQYDTSGNLLQSFAVDGLPKGAYTSAEFIVPPISDCQADFNGDGILDLFDFLAFVNAFNQADNSADCDDSGALDLFDFLCFTNAFNAGC